MRIWLAGSPWRLTGAWLALAGLVATAGFRVQDLPLLSVVLALLLVDPLWGALWAQIGEGQALRLPGGRPWLPYATADGPFGRLLSWYMQIPVLVLAAVVALLVGRIALGLTGLVVILAGLGNLAWRAGLDGWVRWLRVLVLVTLPFCLGVTLIDPWPLPALGLWLAGLAIGYTLLAQAGAVASAPGGQGLTALVLAGVGSGTLIVAMLLAGLMWAAGLAALVAAGPLLLLTRTEDVDAGALQAWWWLLAAVTAAALGLGLGG